MFYYIVNNIIDYIVNLKIGMVRTDSVEIENIEGCSSQYIFVLIIIKLFFQGNILQKINSAKHFIVIRYKNKVNKSFDIPTVLVDQIDI